MWRPPVAGRYRLSDPLGTGGMGRVWLARDEILRRDVAIKEVVLPEGLSPEERDELRQRTMREARAAARLNHPNVIQIYDVVQTEDRPWIVMEYVRSRSLHEALKEDGPFPPYRAATIGLAILAALRAAHAAGVLHRDVKPGNVLLAEDGRVVLTDFGLAVFDTGEGAVTRPGLVLGSPQYVAPERARDGVSSPESDLWSLGATLYAAVEGRAPFARGSAMATLTALATEAVRPAQRAGALKPVLDGLLRKNPRQRLDAAEAERMLRRVAAGHAAPRRRRAPLQRLPAPVRLGGPTPPASILDQYPDGTTEARPAGSRRSRRWVWAAGATAALLLLGSAVILINAARRPDASGATLVTGPSTVVSSGAAGAGSALVDCGTRTVEPSPPAPTPTRIGGLLPGWRWYDDPSGYSVAVAQDWSYSRSDRVVCFRAPDHQRVLAIETLALGPDTVYERWTAREQELTGSGRLPRYAKVALSTLAFHTGAVDWEFTYEESGRQMHAISRGFIVAPGRAYAIHWVVPESEWRSNLVNFNMLAPSFAVR